VDRLSGVRWPVLQSSANLAGGPDPRRLEDVPAGLRAAVDLEIDGGELPGTASTVVDLRRYEQEGEWTVVREGAVSHERIQAVLGWQFHFDPATYAETIRAEIPQFELLQDELTAATGHGSRRILELGTGTGETARRLLAAHPEATLVGLDASGRMLAAARAQLPPERVELRIGRLQGELPAGPFDLVASALCVHHLTGAEKAALFRRVRDVLDPGGRFVLADVVVPADRAEARIPLTPGYDHPSTVSDQLRWLGDAGFEAVVRWAAEDLAVIVANSPH
jgi:tRNA (cmo5U34)-methyltransferase